MELTEYREYLRRIEEADSVRTLHRIATEAQLAHPRDADASSVERACFARAESLIALGRHARAEGLARSGRPLDWRARAAGDE